ncbi:MAG TPA: flagellar hook capping FlgD N-terminal domain-containing protein [bacterium]|nr:flagellar hook capping FlgD N-terminal domain-containing protein [bacterium]
MTSSVSSTTAASTTGASSANAAQQVTQLFLQVLMAELTHQDPTNATDPTAMVTQLAEMTQVDETVQASQATQLQTALGLVGKSVTYLDPTSGASTQGTVSGVGVASQSLTLTINGASIPFGNLSSIP